MAKFYFDVILNGVVRRDREGRQLASLQEVQSVTRDYLGQLGAIDDAGRSALEVSVRSAAGVEVLRLTLGTADAAGRPAA